MTSGPFQPLALGTAPGPDCVQFSPTSHQVCGAFLAYWQTRGQDNGAPGLAYQASLALFGYPLSKNFVDPATGWQTQYFERAVFEWHPGSNAPFQVELRLLGTQQLHGVG
ncbi:MAG TPA: hypothetical protein VHV31_06585 [Nitrolancea sp.]|nr:hypothetical protein [Nitrolancea sp.]